MRSEICPSVSVRGAFERAGEGGVLHRDRDGDAGVLAGLRRTVEVSGGGRSREAGKGALPCQHLGRRIERRGDAACPGGRGRGIFGRSVQRGLEACGRRL